MPYGVYDYNSADQAWNKSAFDTAREKEAENNIADRVATVAQQTGLLNNYTGNINLNNRPVVQNPDGTISTVRSMSFNEDGKEILIPTVSQNGTVMNPQQAIDEYHRTGQHLGVFNSPETANAMARQIHNQQALQYAKDAPTTATQVANMGAENASRKLTPQEYELGVLDYLMNKKGYSLEDAKSLMAPQIAMYKMRDVVDKQNQAKEIAAVLDNLPIDSDMYRKGVFQMAQLDPDLAKMYLAEMVTRKEQYNRGLKQQDNALARQQKREDSVWNADLQLRNKIAMLKASDAYTQQKVQNQYNWLVQNGMDKQQALATALGSYKGGGGKAGATNDGLLNSANLKLIQGEYDKMLEQLQNGTLPESQRARMMFFGKVLENNANRAAGYVPQQAPDLQAIFDQQATKFGYSDELVNNFREYVKGKGYNLSDKDIETLTAKYRNKK